MVDLVRELGIEIAERVVREIGQVDHRVEAAQLIDRDIPHVLLELRNGYNTLLFERALLEQIGVEAHHFVARFDEDRDHNGADVALMAGDQYLHF